MLTTVTFNGKNILIPAIESYYIEAGNDLIINTSRAAYSMHFQNSEDAEKTFNELESHINNFYKNGRN